LLHKSNKFVLTFPLAGTSLEKAKVLIHYATISLNTGIKHPVTADGMDEFISIEGNIHP
jgi:hypothetical protein